MGRIVRVISKDASVVCSAIDGKDIVSRIEEIHKTSAVVTAALGRLAMGTSGHALWTYLPNALFFAI